MPKHLFYYIFLLIIFACKKEEKIELQSIIPPEEIIEIDSIYPSMQDMASDLIANRSVESLLDSFVWEIRDHTYYQILHTDTFYKEEISANHNWNFTFESFMWSPGDTVPHGSLGNTDFRLYLSYISIIDKQWQQSDFEKGDHYFFSPVYYKDSSFSFQLKYTEIFNDTITRIAVRKLHSIN